MRSTRTAGLVWLLALVAALAGVASAQYQILPDGSVALADGEIIGDEALLRAAQAEGKVVLYTSQNASAEIEHAQKFTRQFGIEVEVIRLNGGRLNERLLTEAAANRWAADVITHSDIILLEELYEAGILDNHTPPSDPMFDDTYKRPGIWYTPHSSIQQIGYRTDFISPDEAPKTWQDLLDPKWRGEIGIVQPYAGGTTWTLAYFLRQVLGVEYMKALAAQQPVIYPGAADAGNALVTGEILIVITGDTQIVRHKNDGLPIQEVYPPEGVPQVIYAMAVAKNAPHPNAARLFMNWYLSREGGESITSIRGTYGVRPDVTPAPGKAPISEVNFWVPDTEGLRTHREEWLNEWADQLGYR